MTDACRTAAVMRLETPTSLAVSVAPRSPSLSSSSSPVAGSPKRAGMASGEYLVSGASAMTTTAMGTASGGCPFAAAMPSSRQPVERVAADGTVIEMPRRCPRWVRVLRFSARLIAKQVVMRAAKIAIIGLAAKLRPRPASDQPDAVPHTS